MRKFKTTLQQLIDSKRDFVEILAGETHLNNAVSSICFAESIEDIDRRLWYELVYFSLDLHQGTEEALFNFIEQCNKNGSPGVIIRSSHGSDAEGSLKKWCDMWGLPLLKINSKTNPSEFLYELVMLLVDTENKNRELFRAIKYAVSFPERTEKYFPSLERYGFGKGDVFNVIVIEIENRQLFFERNLLNLVLSIESMLIQEGSRSFILRLEQQLFILFANYEEKEIDKIRKRMEVILSNFSVCYYAAVSSGFKNMENIHKAYSQSMKIISMSRKEKKKDSIVKVNYVSLEKLVISGFHEDILEEIYLKTIGKILAYDQTNQTEYYGLLSKYLKNNCNIRSTCDELFLHRNTLSYQLKKIEDIIEMDLTDEITRVYLYLSLVYGLSNKIDLQGSIEEDLSDE